MTGVDKLLAERVIQGDPVRVAMGPANWCVVASSRHLRQRVA